MNLILGIKKNELMASIEKNAKHHYARWNEEETIQKKEAQLIFRRQKIINMSTLWRGWMFISLHFSYFSLFFLV